jgi:neutral ceramidase
LSTIQAGVGRVTITPPIGMHLIGFAHRPDCSDGLRDDLYATALAISDGVTEVVIVSCDLLMIHPDLVKRVRQDGSARTGVADEHIMVCATHTHSGPATHAYPDSRPMYRAYVDNLAFLLSGVVRMAHDNLAPAIVAFGRGEACIGINRRLTRPDGVTVIAANRDGPTDPEVGVLRVDSGDGQPMAIVVNYACHPVVLGEGSNVISADWPGAMRRVIEQVTGATCLFIQGAGADINPLPGEPSDREDVLERLGTEIGGEVIAVWAGIEPQPANQVAACGERLLVPLLPLSEDEGEVPELVEMAGESVEPIWGGLQTGTHDTTPWTAEIVSEGEERYVAMELQAIRVGDAAVVSAAGEVFVETGLAVKRRSPIANTMFAGYTNGSVGYFPLPEDYPRGGYEINESYLFYRLPTPVAPMAAGLVEETAVRLLNQIAGQGVDG